MGFETNNYLNWYIPMMAEGENAINLHSSGAPAYDLDNAKTDTRGGPWDRFARLEGREHETL